MKKLSEQLKDLSDRVSKAETKATTAQQESKEKVEASLQKSKADAEARRASFKTDVQAKQAAAASDWEALQADFHQKTQQIKNKIETEKEAREVKKAIKRAEDAEDYAVAAIMYVYMAVDEAEVAVLEAIAARAYADSLA
jgi:DNA polymerase II small subunit/DNA polymerase delta subunit B